VVGVVSEYGIALFPQHAALLRASGISPDVARQRNYQSVDTSARLESIDIPRAHRLTPGLLIPVYGPESSNGEAATWQYRPDHPRVDAKGKPVKYVTAQRGMVVDVPPAVRPYIGDPGRPLWITEGIRKVDSAVTAGIDCLAGHRGRGLAPVRLRRGPHRTPHVLVPNVPGDHVRTTPRPVGRRTARIPVWPQTVGTCCMPAAWRQRLKLGTFDPPVRGLSALLRKSTAT
jgi:hypothetical protein